MTTRTHLDKVITRAMMGLDLGELDPLLVQACVEYGAVTTIRMLDRARLSEGGVDALLSDLAGDVETKFGVPTTPPKTESSTKPS